MSLWTWIRLRCRKVCEPRFAPLSGLAEKTKAEAASPPPLPPVRFPESIEAEKLLTQLETKLSEHSQAFPPVRLLPITIVRVPALAEGITSSRIATIKQRDGRQLPLAVQKVTVNIDWSTGEPVTVDIVACGGVAVEAAAGLRNVEINGRTYRLVEVPNVRLAAEPDLDTDEIYR